MGKVHGWRIFKDVHQLQYVCAVKWEPNATKYLFCCVHKFKGGILRDSGDMGQVVMG